MSTSPVSSSTLNRFDSYNRRSASAENTRSPFNAPLNDVSESQHFGMTDQGAGQNAGGFTGGLPEFKNLADVLATLESANSSSFSYKPTTAASQGRLSEPVRQCGTGCRIFSFSDADIFW